MARDSTALPVWAVAHRGASRDRPENTLAAFDEALRQGCDGIELDLRLSSDGIPVVYHDDDLARLGRPERRVEDVAAAELRELDAGLPFDARWAGERVPTLQQVLERYAARTRLLLELKSARDERHDRALVRATIARIRETSAEESVFVLSFHDGILEETARLAPRVPRVLNARPGPRLDAGLRARLPALAALSVDVRGLRPAFGREVNEAGCALWAWTCNTARAVERALQAGASAVISDRPGWLAVRLKERVP